MSNRRLAAVALRGASLLAAVALASGLAAVGAAPVAAADGVTDTASTTYEVQPSRGMVHVTIRKKITNTASNTSRTVTCTQRVYVPGVGYENATGTCRQTTTYYLNTGYVAVDNIARNLEFTTAGGSVGHSVSSKGPAYTWYKVTYPRIYSGASRTVTVSYDLPGGKPRSGSWTRVGKAYVNFCAAANGYDSGDVTVVIPDSFTVTVTPDTIPGQVAAGHETWASGRIADTGAWFRCFEGTAASGFVTQTVTSTGSKPIQILGWPEDPAWRTAMRTDVVAAVDQLETLMGSGLPFATGVKVTEVAATALGFYAGDYNAGSREIRVSDEFTQSGLVAHELSHTWFNGNSLASRWLSEGWAEWAQRQIAPSECDGTGPWPLATPVDLDTWPYITEGSSDKDRQTARYDYAASCILMQAISKQIGPDRMAKVAQALLERTPVYRTFRPATRGAGPADWRDFLDAVDEIGMVPAGVTDWTATEEMLTFDGVADPTKLTNRAAARQAYHALLSNAAGWQIPDAIQFDMENWRFDEAMGWIRTSSGAIADVEAAVASLPGAANGVVQARFAVSGSAADFEALGSLASAEKRAAAVIEAKAAAVDAALPGIDAAHGPALAAFNAAKTGADFAAAADLATAQAAAAAVIATQVAAADAALPGIDAAHGPALAAFRAATTGADLAAAADLATAQAAGAAAAVRSMATADAALPGIDAAHGPALAAFAAARTAEGFANAASLAASQASAAAEVARQLAASNVPRDFITDMGVSDANLPAKRDAAVAAVQAGDASGALAAADALATALASAPDAGRGRLLAIVGGVAGSLAALVALVFAFILVRRRRRSPRIAMATRSPASASATVLGDAALRVRVDPASPPGLPFAQPPMAVVLPGQPGAGSPPIEPPPLEPPVEPPAPPVEPPPSPPEPPPAAQVHASRGDDGPPRP